MNRIKLKNIAIVIAGQSPESKYYNFQERGLPFLQGNRTFGSLYPKIDTWTEKVTKIADEGNVLISVRAPVGDLNISNKILCIGRGLASISAKNKDNRFVFYALKHNIKSLIASSSGTTFSSINKNDLEELKLVIPIRESDRILVSNILSMLDDKIQLNNQINTELEAMAKTLYDYWFVQFDFPFDFAQGKPNVEGKPYKSAGGEMVYDAVLKREIPKGWEVKKLDFFEMYQPKTISEKEMVVDGEYFVFGANGIVGKYDKFNHENSEIVVTCRGSNCGNIIRTLPFSWITGNAMVITSNNKSISSEFIYQTLQWVGISKIISGSGQPQITRTNLETLDFILPDTNLIEKFTEVISSSVQKKYSLYKQNQELASLRDWLLPMLMNGQVRVGESHGQGLGLVAEESGEYKKGKE